MRLTRGVRRAIRPSDALAQTPEEVRRWATFRAFKAGITGAKGEAVVRATLEVLEVAALHDVILRDARGLTQIDHLVRTPNAILVLETKRVSGIVTGELDGVAWVQHLEGSPEQFELPNPLRQNFRHHRAVEGLIADCAVPVRSYLVSAGTAVFEGELRDVLIPVDDLARVVAGGASVSSPGLNAAWEKLQNAAAQSPALRDAHRQELETRRRWKRRPEGTAAEATPGPECPGPVAETEE